QCQRQHYPDDQPDDIGRGDDGHQGADGNNDERVGMERIPEEGTDPLPERDYLGGSAQVAHGFTAFRAQCLALTGVGFRHAAAAIMHLTFTAVPFGWVTRVVMTIVFQSEGPDPSENSR